MNGVAIGPVIVDRAGPLTVIAGPCQLEDCAQAIEIAGHVAQICAGLGMGYIFKASFDKANRTSISGARGPGIEAGLRMLAEVRETIGCPVLTDVHLPEQCAPVAEVAHVLQIPAFLCRQTDLLLAAGQTGAAVNIKKGQFLAPWDVAHAAEKVASTRNARILLTERGTSFGYNTLVADMRSLEVMAETGYPVIFDATHSVQMPGGAGASSSGERRFVAPLARAAVAVGVAGIFLETHPDPDTAPSDGPNMVPLGDMEPLLAQLQRIAEAAVTRSDE